MSVDENDRKLFVGGLPQEASDEDVKEYFGQYGEIESVNLKMDPQTGRSRGFAFILFKDNPSLCAASAQEAHVIKGKKVTCKKAEAKPGKIYVGKLPSSGLTTEEVQAHFNQFGTVTEVIRPVDKTNNDEPKNFAFITFEKEEVARQLVKEGTTNLNGHDLVIKKVVPKDGSGGFAGRGGGRGGGPGYAGGWGGYGDPYGMYGGGGYGDPYGMYGGGGYGGGGYGGYGGAGGKAPRGGPGTRGRGRSRPY